MSERAYWGSDLDEAERPASWKILFVSLALPAMAAAGFVLLLTTGDGGGEAMEATAETEVSSVEVASLEVRALALASAAKSARPVVAEPAATGQAGSGASRGLAEVAGAELRLEPLAGDDPRWTMGRAQTVARREEADIAAALRLQAAERDETPGETANPVRGMERDPTTTASIDRPQEGIAVPVAENDAQIAALEAAAALGSSDETAAFSDTGMRMLPARAKKYVNFRDAPSNDSEVIRVVAYDEAFDAQPVEGCVHFCAVRVDGRPGYIHKAFISYESDAAARTDAE